MPLRPKDSALLRQNMVQTPTCRKCRRCWVGKTREQPSCGGCATTVPNSRNEKINAYTYGIGDAVVKGGRYDNLLRKFGKDAAAIGFVIVIDDLLEALSRQKVDITLPASGRVLYYSIGDEADYQAKLAEAMKLRKEGIPTVLSPENKAAEEVRQ